MKFKKNISRKLLLIDILILNFDKITYLYDKQRC